jgi:hypothetical protein
LPFPRVIVRCALRRKRHATETGWRGNHPARILIYVGFMTTMKSRLLRCALIAACVVSIDACSRPLTDIVATTSEDVGPWDVANAQARDRTLTANVCMHRPGSADDISDRLLLQLINKGYDRIELAMYAPASEGGAVRQQVSWTAQGGKQLQPESQVSDNPCATSPHGSEQSQGGHEQ